MQKYVVLTDSCADIGRKIREECDVDYIRMSISSSEGRQYESDLDWGEFSAPEFYNMMRRGVEFKTAQVNIETYIEGFRKYLEQGYDILYLSASGGLSGSINSSIIAKNMLADEFPDATIICIDTLRGTMGQGLIVYRAGLMRKEGKAIHEVAKWVEDNKLRCNQAGTVDDLKYLKRAGRVTGAATFMSTVFNIKPIIISNRRGENESVAKVIGRKASIKELVRHLKERGENLEEQTIFLTHADCPEDVKFAIECINAEVKVKDIYVDYVGCTVGSTTGPGMMGIFFFGKEVER